VTKSQTNSASDTLDVYQQCFRNFRKYGLDVPDSFMDIVSPPDTQVALLKHARTMRTRLDQTRPVTVHHILINNTVDITSMASLQKGQSTHQDLISAFKADIKHQQTHYGN
jgi:hypothetical protein